jgi:adenylylsulfate kinase-like enzyme
VYVKVALDEARKRDPKGLYARAAQGEIADLTGVSSPYEEPQTPEIVVDTTALSVDDAVERILAAIKPMLPRSS